MSFSRFFLLFTIVSLVEILLFVKVGERIGPAWTVISVLATATVGVYIMRYQGFLTLRRIQTSLNEGQIPGQALIEGALIMVSGALLLTPGFLTDGIGFALLVPALRGPFAAGLLVRGVFQVLGGDRPSIYTSTYSQRTTFTHDQTGSGQDDVETIRARRASSNPPSGDVIEGEYERKDD